MLFPTLNIVNYLAQMGDPKKIGASRSGRAKSGPGEEGLSQCLHFFFWTREVNFLLFCVDVLYGWPLSKKQQS